jgi:hypothetical protein
MHYILIIGMLSMPFPTYEDCIVQQAIRGGVCIEKSYGTAETPEQAKQRIDRYLAMPLLTNEKPKQPSNGVQNTPLNHSAGKPSTPFMEGFKEEMAKPEPVSVMEQDI